MKTSKLFLIGIFLLLLVNFVSASRLPSVGSDNSTWGDILNDYLAKLAGANATVTNQYLNGSFLPEITNLFDLGNSLLKWANIYVTNLYASKIYSDDWSNVTIQESQISDLQSYLTSESDPLYSAWDKDYGDLINTPTIPTIWDATFNTTGDNRWGRVGLAYGI
jgi:hypothetical protein